MELIQETKHRITLIEEIDALKRIVHLKSHYAGSRVFGQSGTSQEKNISLGANENDFFELALREAATNVYDELQSVTALATNPFVYDGTIDSKRIISYEIVMSEDWDVQLSRSLHIAIEKALTSWVLKEWYALTSAVTQYAVAEAEYLLAINNIHSILIKRKKRISLTYRGL